MRAAPANQSVRNASAASAMPGSTRSTCAPSPARRSRGAGDDGRDLGVDPRVSEVGAERDAQAADPVLRVLAERRRGRLERGRVAPVGLGEDVEQQRDVADGAGHRPGVGEHAERARGPGGDAAERRLQPGLAAEAGRDADRAAAVRAQRERHHAGAERRGAATARAARRRRRVPGIAGDAVQGRVGHALPAELGRRRLAREDRAVPPQRSDGGRVGVPRLLRVDRAGAPQGRPAAREQDVLDRDGHAVEDAQRLAARPARLGGRGLGARAIGIDEAERVHSRVVALDRGEGRLERLERRQGARAEGLQQRGGVGERGHRGSVGSAALRPRRHHRLPLLGAQRR